MDDGGVIDLQLKSDSGQLSRFIEIIDYPYTTFVVPVQTKTKLTLCWSVPYITPLEIGFYQYLRM